MSSFKNGTCILVMSKNCSMRCRRWYNFCTHLTIFKSIYFGFRSNAASLVSFFFPTAKQFAAKWSSSKSNCPLSKIHRLHRSPFFTGNLCASLSFPSCSDINISKCFVRHLNFLKRNLVDIGIFLSLMYNAFFFKKLSF